MVKVWADGKLEFESFTDRWFVLFNHPQNNFVFFYAPAICNGGGGPCPYVRPVSPVPYVQKMVSRRYLLNTLVYWIHISYTGI